MLNKEVVEKIAKLARLELKPDELTLYQERLGRVLGYIQELEAVGGAEAGFVKHVPADAVALRADQPEAFPGTREILTNAPSAENHQFLLPTVVEQSE